MSVWRRAELEGDLGIAVLRSFLQLTAVGYVIQAIFDSDSLLLVALLLSVMVGVGTWTARSRARGVPGATVPIALGLGVAAATTVGIVVALGVFDPEPRYLVPVGGMVIGNAMTAAAVALNRLADEVNGQARTIEATLALGATARQATAGLMTRSLRSGMIPVIDQTKTTGIVAFPGAMVGMLLAGAEPVDAVRLQLDPAVGADGRGRALGCDRGVAGVSRVFHGRTSAARPAETGDRGTGDGLAAHAGPRAGRAGPATT